MVQRSSEIPRLYSTTWHEHVACGHWRALGLPRRTNNKVIAISLSTKWNWASTCSGSGWMSWRLGFWPNRTFGRHWRTMIHTRSMWRHMFKYSRWTGVMLWIYYIGVTRDRCSHSFSSSMCFADTRLFDDVYVLQTSIEHFQIWIPNMPRKIFKQSGCSGPRTVRQSMSGLDRTVALKSDCSHLGNLHHNRYIRAALLPVGMDCHR